MKDIIFPALGGLGMFLFGMKIMSEGLQKVAGNKIREILQTVSNNRVIGCGVGALVTSLIQSSSATTVILVSFVDAGLMNFMQATGVILGANIGTTITGQLIAFKITKYALPAIAMGAFLKFFMGRQKWVYVGDVMLGFGLLFFGLATMKAGFAPLKESASFIDLFMRFNAGSTGGIMLCVMTGALLTMVLQSSSATVGITMALATQGLIGFEASVALILGENIGTTITAQLASIGSSVNAHRTANAHTMFNVIGVLLIILIFPAFIKLVSYVTGTWLHFGVPELLIDGEKPNMARYIANAHTLFNVVSALFFLLVLPYMVKVVTWLTPSTERGDGFEDLHHIKFIDNKFVDTPSVALTQAKEEVIRMGEAVKLMYEDVIESVNERKLKELSKWRKREATLDNLQKEIIQFLVHVMQKTIMLEESNEVSSLMRMTNNFERIGDNIENIAEAMEELIDEGLYLSEGGMKDYMIITDEVHRFIEFVIKGIKENDRELMPKAKEMEENINRMREEMKGNHIMRLQSGVCTVDSGLILIDMISAFEKIGDCCYNIAQAVAWIK
jgi:phosphate:Na+ symporter